MSKTISQALQGADLGKRPQPGAAIEADIKRLFMLFHGWYGALFLARYATGDTGVDGKDRGTMSAMLVWQSRLAAFDGEVVRAAAERCETDHPQYPPTLPEFVAICRAVKPRVTTQEQFKIQMSEGLRSSYTARARAEAMARYRANERAAEGAVATDDGYPGLQQLVASAVSLAGGDEVAVLRRFDMRRVVA